MWILIVWGTRWQFLESLGTAGVFYSFLYGIRNIFYMDWCVQAEWPCTSLCGERICGTRVRLCGEVRRFPGTRCVMSWWMRSRKQVPKVARRGFGSLVLLVSWSLRKVWNSLNFLDNLCWLPSWSLGNAGFIGTPSVPNYKLFWFF
jgi:hypothetical protein